MFAASSPWKLISKSTTFVGLPLLLLFLLLMLPLPWTLSPVNAFVVSQYYVKEPRSSIPNRKNSIWIFFTPSAPWPTFGFTSTWSSSPFGILHGIPWHSEINSDKWFQSGHNGGRSSFYSLNSNKTTFFSNKKERANTTQRVVLFSCFGLHAPRGIEWVMFNPIEQQELSPGAWSCKKEWKFSQYVNY